MKRLRYYNINNVLDIGANYGQYGTELRRHKYNGKITSFEPLEDAYKGLVQVSSNDNDWTANNFAIGNENGLGRINIAGNSHSSSIKNMNQAHIDSAPNSKYVDTQNIEIKTLDSIYDRYCEQDDNVMMKVDTQGFEKEVVDGALGCLKNVTLVQLELSLVPLYENEFLFIDMVMYMAEQGFRLIAIEDGFSNPKTGEQLQVDGVFANRISK